MGEMSALTSEEVVQKLQRGERTQDWDQDREEEAQAWRKSWEKAASGHCGGIRLVKLHYQRTEVEGDSGQVAGQPASAHR